MMASACTARLTSNCTRKKLTFKYIRQLNAVQQCSSDYAPLSVFTVFQQQCIINIYSLPGSVFLQAGLEPCPQNKSEETINSKNN